jgi:hypothetical protein
MRLLADQAEAKAEEMRGSVASYRHILICPPHDCSIIKSNVISRSVLLMIVRQSSRTSYLDLSSSRLFDNQVENVLMLLLLLLCFAAEGVSDMGFDSAKIRDDYASWVLSFILLGCINTNKTERFIHP